MSTHDHGLDPSTVAVTAGRPPPRPGNPVNVPVTLSSTFFAGGVPVYGRDHNENWLAFEDVMGALEGGHAVAFASGMAAVSAVASLVPQGGPVVAPRDAYNRARELFETLHIDGRVSLRPVDITDTSAVLAACHDAYLLWIESPTNPMLGVADLGALMNATPLVAVDNTFATPLAQRPLALGADVVVHSATKLISGHADVVLGVAVAASAETADRLRHHRSLHGAIPGPMETFLALRGLRTLPVRLERASRSASVLAGRLGDHPAVEHVRYPGFGTMISFDVTGGARAADIVCDAVRLVIAATSLGGVESLIERRAKYAREERTPPGLLRFSVGLEHPDDLWADLAQALAQIT